MMRKKCWLLVLALTGPGCLSSGTHGEAKSQQPPVQIREAPPPPAITADQVNEANAASIPQALGREMDYEANQLSAAPAMPTTNTNLTKP
jgi:hypothetical protein